MNGNHWQYVLNAIVLTWLIAISVVLKSHHTVIQNEVLVESGI